MAQYGRGEPILIESGYLFVDLKYMMPPYTVQRVGSGVVVNDTLMSCPLGGPLPSTNRLAKAQNNWRDPLRGFKHDTYKKVARANVLTLTTILKHNSALFLSSKENKPMRLPVRGKFRESEFRMILQVLADQGPEDSKVAKLQRLVKSGQLTYYATQVFRTADNIKQFEQRSMQSTNFMARATELLAEGEKADAVRPRAVPKK